VSAPKELMQGGSDWCLVCWTSPAALKGLSVPDRPGELNFSYFQPKPHFFCVLKYLFNLFNNGERWRRGETGDREFLMNMMW